MSIDAGDVALKRFALLRPHLENGISLTAVAGSADVPIGMLRRWLRS